MDKKKSIMFFVLLSAQCSFSYSMDVKEADVPAKRPSRRRASTELFAVIKKETPEQIQERVVHLLSIGGDINDIYEYHRTHRQKVSLLRVVAPTSLPKCKILVNAKADPTFGAADRHQSPLHRVASSIVCSLQGQLYCGGQAPYDELVEIFKYLVRSGADAHAKAGFSDKPDTPLSRLDGKIPELVLYVKEHEAQQKRIQKEKKRRLKEQKKITQWEERAAEGNEEDDDEKKKICLLQ